MIRTIPSFCAELKGKIHFFRSKIEVSLMHALEIKDIILNYH